MQKPYRSSLTSELSRSAFDRTQQGLEQEMKSLLLPNANRGSPGYFIAYQSFLIRSPSRTTFPLHSDVYESGSARNVTMEDEPNEKKNLPLYTVPSKHNTSVWYRSTNIDKCMNMGFCYFTRLTLGKRISHCIYFSDKAEMCPEAQPDPLSHNL